MISYGVFTKNGDNMINGAHLNKQVVLINGMPFEMKSIYGMETESDAVEGQDAQVIDSGEIECTVCLTE